MSRSSALSRNFLVFCDRLLPIKALKIRFFTQFKPVDGNMLKSLALKLFDVVLDRFEFFKGKYAGFVKADKVIFALLNP